MQAALLRMAFGNAIVKVRVDKSCPYDTRTTTIFADHTSTTTRTIKNPVRPILFCPSCYGIPITNNPPKEL